MYEQLARLVAQQERSGINCPSKSGVWNIRPLRRTVDQDKHCRGLGEDYVRRVVLDWNRARLLLGLQYSEQCLEPVKRHRCRSTGQKRLDCLLILGRLVQSRREIGFLDLDLLEPNSACFPIDNG